MNITKEEIELIRADSSSGVLLAEELKKSNDLLESITDGRAFCKDTGLIWEHWLDNISLQIEVNNRYLSK